MTKIIDGKDFAQKIRYQVKEDSDYLLKNKDVQPCLAVVLVGENPASKVYVGAKTKMAAECNIKTKDFKMEDTTDQKTLLKIIEELNNDSSVHGILVQLPLPKQIDERAVIDAMNAVVIGRSNIVGKPMSQLLIEESCTVTVVHSRTKDIEEICSRADIIIAAVGRPEMIKSNWIKKDAIIIDVGINRIPTTKSDGSEGTKLVGDVDYKDVFEKSSAITPVPGGVGPMTIACLLRNTVTSAYRHTGLDDPRGTVS